MSVSVNPPKTPLTKGSNGIATATLPNICKMPGPPAPFVPAPLPNIGKSGDSPKGYSKKVKIEGNTVAIKGASFKSMGDMASKGTGGGMLSANTHGPCKFISPGSMDVKFEGKNVHLLSDMVTNNGGPSGSPPNAATLMGAVQAAGVVHILRKELCPVCGEVHKDFKESPETQTSADGLVSAYKVVKAWNPTMIGVVECTKGHKHAGATTRDHNFTDVAKAAHHPFPATGVSTGDKLEEHVGTSMLAKAAGARKYWENCKAKVKDGTANAKEKKEAKATRNKVGACAAQKVLVWTLSHECTPAAITEKWFSPGRRPTKAVPARKKRRKAGPIRHINIKGKLVEYKFSHGKSVPPCETCNMLLPFLTCQEEKEESCEKCPEGCAKKKGGSK